MALARGGGRDRDTERDGRLHGGALGVGVMAVQVKRIGVLRCTRCGFEDVQYDILASSYESGQQCPECWAAFLRERIGYLELAKDTDA